MKLFSFDVGTKYNYVFELNILEYVFICLNNFSGF